ncbi:MAG: lipoyl synthase [Firmicutes bacterium]|jgi:lipoic acid synthetase|nr:lipoyl synthase [Bacillota bacterium]
MHKRKPEWLKIKYRSSDQVMEVQRLIHNLDLHTVCEEAGCPNLLECFGRRTATFMILGRYCTRSCTFCNVESNHPQPVDPKEGDHVASAVSELGLKHVVITSVTRDDLPDGGAFHFAAVITKVREQNPHVEIEVLIPDFKGDVEALAKVVAAKPSVLNHNVETVPRLYPQVRPQARYERSLELLANAKKLDPKMITKSGMMVGLGETVDEVKAVMEDLRAAGCDLLTIGQYLAPSKNHHPVVEYIHPDTFQAYKEIGLELGFTHVESGPLVRSSYQAEAAANALKS